MKTLMFSRQQLLILMLILGQMPTCMLAMEKSVQPQASASAQSGSSAVASVAQPSSIQTGVPIAPTPLVAESTVLPVAIASASTGTSHEATVNVSASVNSENSSVRADDGKEAKKSSAVLQDLPTLSEIPFFPLLPEATLPAEAFSFDVQPLALVDSFMPKSHTLSSHRTILSAAASSAQSSSRTELSVPEEKHERSFGPDATSASVQMPRLPDPIAAPLRAEIVQNLVLTQAAVSSATDRAALEKMSFYCKGWLPLCNPFADIDIEASLHATIKSIDEKIRTLSQSSVASSSAAALSSASSSVLTAASKGASVSSSVASIEQNAGQKKAPLPVVQSALRKKLVEEYQKVSSSEMSLGDLQTLAMWCNKNLAAFSFDQVPDIQQGLVGLKHAVDTKLASLQALQRVIQQTSAKSTPSVAAPVMAVHEATGRQTGSNRVPLTPQDKEVVLQNLKKAPDLAFVSKDGLGDLFAWCKYHLDTFSFDNAPDLERDIRKFQREIDERLSKLPQKKTLSAEQKLDLAYELKLFSVNGMDRQRLADTAFDYRNKLALCDATADADLCRSLQTALDMIEQQLQKIARAQLARAVQPPPPLLPSAESATDNGAPVRGMFVTESVGQPIVAGSSSVLSASMGHSVMQDSRALATGPASSEEKYTDEIKVSMEQVRLRGVTSSLVPDSTVLAGLRPYCARYLGVGAGGIDKAMRDAVLVEEFGLFGSGVERAQGLLGACTRDSHGVNKRAKKYKLKVKVMEANARAWEKKSTRSWTPEDFRFWLGRTCLGMPNSLQLLVWFKEADGELAKFSAPFKRHKHWYCKPVEFNNLLTDLGFRKHANSMGIMVSSFVGWIPGIDIKDAALEDLIKTEHQQIENDTKALRQQQEKEAKKQAESVLRAQQERDAAAKKANEDERLKEERRKKAAADAQAALEQQRILAALEQERLRIAKAAQAAEAKSKAEQEALERRQKEEVAQREREEQLRAREEIEARRKQARLDEENQKKRAAAEAAEEAERARVRAEKQKARELEQQKKEAFEASLEKVAGLAVKAVTDEATKELLTDLKKAREEEQQKKAAAEEAERKRLAIAAETKAFVKNIALNARCYHLVEDAITEATQEYCEEQNIAVQKEVQKIKEAEIEAARVKAEREAKLAADAENKKMAAQEEAAIKEKIKRAEEAFQQEAARLEAQAQAANAKARATEAAKKAEEKAKEAVSHDAVVGRSVGLVQELAHVSEADAVQPIVDVLAEQQCMQQAALVGVTDKHEEKHVEPVQSVQQEQSSQPVVQATVVAQESLVLPQGTGLLGTRLLPGVATEMPNDSRRLKNAQIRAAFREQGKQTEDKQEEPKAAESPVQAVSEKEAIDQEVAAKVAREQAEKVAAAQALAEQQARELEARSVANEKVLMEQRMRAQAAAIDAKKESKNTAMRYAVTSIKTDIMLAMQGNAGAIARLNSWISWMNQPSDVQECQHHDRSIDVAVIHAAVSLLQPYAEQGSRIAQYFMALYYASAIMTNDNVDEEKSLSYFVQSAKQEYIPSLQRLALCLDRGIDTQAITAKSQELWKQARIFVDNFRHPEDSKQSHKMVAHGPFVPTLPIIVESNREDCLRDDCHVLSNPLPHCAMSSSAVYSHLPGSVATPIDPSAQKAVQTAATELDAKEPKRPQAMAVVSAVVASGQMDEAMTILYNNVQAALNRGKMLQEAAKYGVALQYFKKAAEHSCGVPALKDLHDEAINLIGKWYSCDATRKAQANDRQGEAQAGKDLVDYFLKLGKRGSQVALNYANRILASIWVPSVDERKQAVQPAAAVEASVIEQQIIARAKAAQQVAGKDGKEAKESVSASVVVKSVAEQLDKEATYYDVATDHATRLIWRGADYLEGTNGVRRDLARAFEFFARAEVVSRRSDQHAQVLAILGECYFKGYGVPREWGLAEEYFAQAAKEGYSDIAWILPNIGT